MGCGRWARHVHLAYLWGGRIWRAIPDSRNYRHKTMSDIQQSIGDGYMVTAAASGGKELAEYKPASRQGGNRLIEIESK